jgi:hypothetical protein
MMNKIGYQIKEELDLKFSNRGAISQDLVKWS